MQSISGKARNGSFRVANSDCAHGRKTLGYGSKGEEAKTLFGAAGRCRAVRGEPPAAPGPRAPPPAPATRAAGPAGARGASPRLTARRARGSVAGERSAGFLRRFPAAGAGHGSRVSAGPKGDDRSQP